MAFFYPPHFKTAGAQTVEYGFLKFFWRNNVQNTLQSLYFVTEQHLQGLPKRRKSTFESWSKLNMLWSCRSQKFALSSSAHQWSVSSEKFRKLILCHKIALPCHMHRRNEPEIWPRKTRFLYDPLFATSPPQIKNEIESDKPTGTSTFSVPARPQHLYKPA